MERISEFLNSDNEFDFLVYHHCELYGISHEFHLSIGFDIDMFLDEFNEQHYSNEEIENLILKFNNWVNRN